MIPGLEANDRVLTNIEILSLKEIRSRSSLLEREQLALSLLRFIGRSIAR